MCLQCVSESITIIDQILPGFSLCLATKPDPRFPKWGLVECNDPTFMFEVDPISDPWENLTDEEIDSENYDVKKEEEFSKRYEEFKKSFNKVYPTTGYDLVKACIESGYNREKDGWNVIIWLFNYIGNYLERMYKEYVLEEDTKLTPEAIKIKNLLKIHYNYYHETVLHYTTR